MQCSIAEGSVVGSKPSPSKHTSLISPFAFRMYLAAAAGSGETTVDQLSSQPSVSVNPEISMVIIF
eukprot:COSAG01_NODE_68661_length_263_cov_0.951220_1_plen_65_part_10